MLGKRFLASAYVLALSYSLSCAGEPVKTIKPLAKNVPQAVPANYTPTTKLGEVTVNARSLKESRLKRLAESNNSSIPWTKRASSEFEYLTPDYMRISGVQVFHINPRKESYNSQKSSP